MGSLFALFLNMHRLWTGSNRVETTISLVLILFCVFLCKRLGYKDFYKLMMLTVIPCFLAAAGLASAAKSIIHSYRSGAIDFPFSCELSSG